MMTTAVSPAPLHPQIARGHDFDLHGLVGIRLVDASERDRNTVAAQLGPIAKPLNRSPDIVIRFVDQLRTSAPLRLIGAGEAGYNDDVFLVLRSRHKVPARVQIAFDDIGGCCEIVCERGLSAVPLLLGIINLTVLAKGGLALHATAFEHQGRGILVTGWSKSGKTETLLAFLDRGARYVGDEWIYLSSDGTTMFGLPEPVRVWDWQLSQLPHYRHLLDRRDRARLRTLRYASMSLDRLSRRASSGYRHRMLRLSALIERQRYAFLRPERAFAGGASARGAQIDHLIFLANVEAGGANSWRVQPAWVADRMAFSMEEERQPLASAYRQFRFAFPDRRNRLIESATSLETLRMRELLSGRPCHAVYHTYPPRISELFDTIEPLVRH